MRQFFTSSSRTPSSRRVFAPDTESDDEPEPLPRVATQPQKRIRTYLTKKSKRHALVLVKDLVNNTPNRISSGRRKESTNSSRGRASPLPLSCDTSPVGRDTDVENSRPSLQSTPMSPSLNVESDTSVKAVLQEITSLLNTVVKRVENVETELKKQSGVSSSSDLTPSCSKKVHVPLLVRVSCFFTM